MKTAADKARQATIQKANAEYGAACAELWKRTGKRPGAPNPAYDNHKAALEAAHKAKLAEIRGTPT